MVSFGRQARGRGRGPGEGPPGAITGRLEHRQWEAQDACPRSRHEIVANQIFLAKPPTDGAAESQPAYANGEERNLLAELIYRLLANTDSPAQDRDRAAILGYWASSNRHA